MAAAPQAPPPPAPRPRVASHTELLRAAAQGAERYLQGLAGRPAAPSPETQAGLEHLRGPLPEVGWGASEVLSRLERWGSPATVASNGGRYFGFVNGGTDPAAHAASVLASAWDQNTALAVMSPAASLLDEMAANWVVQALELPEGCTASFCSGATLANLTGVIAARDALLARAGWDAGRRGLWGAPRLRVVVGDEVHVSALRALRLAGFGSDALQRVPTDAQGRMRADAFPDGVDERTLVLLQAGNVDTGDCDPFQDVVPRARERGAWVHVDGAFGLWAAASARRRHLVAGVEGADSWATDAHKWLNVAYDCGIVIARSAADLRRPLGVSAAYLCADEARQPMQLGIQMSQRARGVEVWAMLASHGRAGLAALVDRHCDLARELFEQVVEGGGEPLATPVLNQALVAFGDDAATDDVIRRVQADGRCWVGGTTFHGRRAMRLSVSDVKTTRADIDRSALAITECARHVAEQGAAS